MTTAAWIGLGNGSSEMLRLRNPADPERIVRLIARPNPIDLDLGSPAVLVVDMQNDFCSKGGLLDLQGVDLSIIQRTIDPTRIVLSTARKVGLKVVCPFHPERKSI